MTHLDMDGLRWPLADAPATRTTAGLADQLHHARSDDLAVHHTSTQAVPVDCFTADDRLLTDRVELAAVRRGWRGQSDGPQWRPAQVVDGRTCFLTGRIEPGRYTLQARRDGVVVTAGGIAVT